jgi:hypothetical protein
MARGNGRQDIVRDDVDRKWLQEQLGKAAIRCSRQQGHAQRTVLTRRNSPPPKVLGSFFE